MREILHKELSYKIVGILYEVHKKLGRFCSHKQYCDAFEILLNQNNVKYKREVEIPIEFENEKLFGNRLDFLIEDLIPVDVKAKKFTTQADYVQMKRYLHATKRKLGLVVNFREISIKPKRIINSKGEK